MKISLFLLLKLLKDLFLGRRLLSRWLLLLVLSLICCHPQSRPTFMVVLIRLLLIDDSKTYYIFYLICMHFSVVFMSFYNIMFVVCVCVFQVLSGRKSSRNGTVKNRKNEKNNQVFYYRDGMPQLHDGRHHLG